MSAKELDKQIEDFEGVEVDVVKNFEQRGPEVPVVQDAPVADILALATKNNMTAEQMEKYWEIQKDIIAAAAKKAYVVAMAAFKKNPPKIIKTQPVKYQNKDKTWTEYRHANLADVAQEIGKGLAEHDLFAAWTTEQGQGGLITLKCTITHRDGHFESTELAASPDQSGGKNNIQAIGSTISYLERYTILALTGLATHEMDNDGRGNTPNGKPLPKITDEQLANLIALCEGLGMPAEATLQRLVNAKYKKHGIEKIEDLPENWYENAVTHINKNAEGK